MMKRLLVVAVHPDDETLGCGGTLLRLKAEDRFIHWLVVTSIYTKDDKEALTKTSCGQNFPWKDEKINPVLFPKDQMENRVKELKQVRDAYSFDSVYELCWPAMCLDQVPIGVLVNDISRVMHEVRPDTVILPFKADIHSDHRVVFEAAYSCTKTFRYPFVRRVMMMETLSETDFAPCTKEDMFCPNVFVDITDYIQKKIDIMSLYAGEMASPPFPRSAQNICSLAINRGSTSGFEYAESFMLLKECF
jgi:LmbE family N-acetylglucosaminyl deacetylase